MRDTREHNTHQFPLTLIDQIGKRTWTCERCGRTFSEPTPTCFPGCCKEADLLGSKHAARELASEYSL